MMSFPWAFRVLMFGLLLLAGLVGCRRPPAIVVKKRRAPVHYDTRFEAMLEKTDRPLIHGGFGPFVEVLDEPVAVVRAAGKATTWEVFFATNRGLITATANGNQHRYGNEHERAVNCGRAEIMIPWRRRGFDPEREPSGESQRDAGSDPFRYVKFDEVRSISWSELAAGVNRQVARSRQKDLLLFVHGFNVDFESALIRTAQVAVDLPFNGAVVSYCWPSQGGMTPSQYKTDEIFNAKSVEPFAAFLQQLIADLPADTRINIVVHSMGNRIVMQAISQLPQAANKPIANVCLCAPDVGVSDFQKWAPGVVAQAERVTLYASTGDGALIVSKSVNQEQRAGDSHPPVIVAGVDTIDISAVDFDFLGHSYYGSNVDVMSDLFRVIKFQSGPETCTYLSKCEINGRAYWYFSDFADVLSWKWNFETTLQR